MAAQSFSPNLFDLPLESPRCQHGSDDRLRQESISLTYKPYECQQFLNTDFEEELLLSALSLKRDA